MGTRGGEEGVTGDGDATPTSTAATSSAVVRRNGRRDALVALVASVADAAVTAPAAIAAKETAETTAETLLRLQREAAAYYDAQDFDKAFDALSQLRNLEPGNPNWIEGRAQVGVDAKRFKESIADYTALLVTVDAETDGGSVARFRAGRALAYEGLYAWPLALKVRYLWGMGYVWLYA